MHIFNVQSNCCTEEGFDSFCGGVVDVTSGSS